MGAEEFTPLKIFLKREAKQLHKLNLAKTYVLVEQEARRVWGYVTLLCTQVKVECANPGDVLDYRYKDFPALRLARLAVDSRLRKRDYGRSMLDFAVATAVEISASVGCRFLIVDAKQSSVGFYRRHGFQTALENESVTENSTLMFLDLHKRLGGVVQPQ